MLAIAASAPVAAQEPRLRERTLVVAIWERRAPAVDAGSVYAATQRRNRETLLSILYDGKKALIADRGSTVLAIYPEGVEQPRVKSYDRRPEALWRSLSEMVALPDAAGPVHGLIANPAPERDALDQAIRAHITFPLVGLYSWRANDSTVDEGMSPSDIADPSGARRAISHPPLLTAWAILDAAERTGTRNDLFSNVYVIWLHGGERNYAINNPYLRIKGDYGIGAAQLYDETRKLYSLQRDERHGVDGELADGNVVVSRVLPRRLVRQLPAAGLRDGKRAASMRYADANIWPVPFFGKKFAAEYFRKSTGGIPWPHWSYQLETPGYSLLHGDFHLARGGSSTPVQADGTIGDGMRQMLERAVPVGEDRWSVDDEIYVDALLEPAVESDVPAYLRSSMLSIPYRHRTEAVPVSVQLSTLPPLYSWIVSAIVVSILIATVAHVRHRRALRMLGTSFDWRGVKLDDIVVERASSLDRGTFGLSLIDRSGFSPVNAWIGTTVKVETSPGTIPLKPDRALFALRTSDRNSKRSKRSSEQVEVLRPSKPQASQPTPFHLTFDAGAIDFDRVTSQDVLEGLCVVTVSTSQSARYDELHHIEAQHYRVRVQAALPHPTAKVVIAEPIRRIGLFRDPLQESQADDFLGTVVVRNSAAGDSVSLDLTVTPRKLSASIVSRAGKVEQRDLPCEVFPVRDRDAAGAEARKVNWAAAPSKTATIRSNGTAVYKIFVQLPGGKRWTEEPRWYVRFGAIFSASSSASRPLDDIQCEDETRWLPVDRLSFVCLDLGTSSTRILIQGESQPSFGYLQFPATLKRGVWSIEDLPSRAYVDPDTNPPYVRFAADADDGFRDGVDDGNKLFDSVKELMLSRSGDYTAVLKAYVKQLLKTFYEKTVHEFDRDRQEVEVVRVGGGRENVLRGKRHVLIATVPNEASRKLIESYRKAVEQTTLFRDFIALREAEAAALWFAKQADKSLRGKDKIRVLAVDIGAGSTDVAVVEVKEDSVRVIARGGVQVAGNWIDQAILKVLPGVLDIDRAEFGRAYASDPRGFHEQAQGVKFALAEEEEADFRYESSPRQIRRGSLDRIAASAEYRKAIREIAEEPILMLIGRTPEMADLKEINVLLLTGRGALIRGVRDQIQATLAANGIAPAVTSFDKADPSLLKATVSLGARMFGIGAWPTMTLSDDLFPDRIVLVAMTPAGPVAQEVLPASTKLDSDGTLHPEPVALTIPEWSDAIVIQTWMRMDGDGSSVVAITPDRMSVILRRAAIPGLRMPGYSVISDEIPRWNPRLGAPMMTLVLHRTGRIDCEITSAPRRRTLP